MKHFILGFLIVMLAGIGCTKMRKQEKSSIPLTGQYNTKVQSVPQASTPNIEALSIEGDTPLILASRQGALKTVQALLARGADINAANAQGFTALMVASQGGHVDVIKELATDKKLDLEAMNWNMDTAPMIAVQSNHLETVKALLSIGANPNFVKAGMTVLIAASYKGNSDIVRELLEAGADPYPVDENGESALDVAINTDKPAVAAVLREYQK